MLKFWIIMCAVMYAFAFLVMFMIGASHATYERAGIGEYCKTFAPIEYVFAGHRLGCAANDFPTYWLFKDSEVE